MKLQIAQISTGQWDKGEGRIAVRVDCPKQNLLLDAADQISRCRIFHALQKLSKAERCCCVNQVFVVHHPAFRRDAANNAQKLTLKILRS